MINARRYHPTNTRFFIWILRHTYGAWLKNTYNTRAKGVELIETIKPPFIVVGNHSTLLDPFLTNYYIPHPIHWVTSDGNMRSPIMRFLLIKLVGSIPKSKAVPDIETVSWIVEIIRKKKGVVGVYPEGQSSWNGASISAFGSTAKLIKLLKVPVICAVTRGAYMTKPRWAYTKRRGSVEIEFSELFTPQSIKKLSVAEIDARLNEAISHDDPEWCRQNGLKFADPKRAECLELALYACPSCGALHTLEGRGELIACTQCGFSAEYREDGSFAVAGEGTPRYPPHRSDGLKSAGAAFFESIREWDIWQSAHLEQLLRTKFLPHPEEPIFSDKNVRLLKGKRMDTMKNLGRGLLSLTAKALVFTAENGVKIAFDTKKLEGPGVLKRNYFEFYVGKTVYRVKFGNRAASGRKYAVALDLLSGMRGTEA